MMDSRRRFLGGPHHVVSASASCRGFRSPTHATCPSGRISTALGAVISPRAGSSHGPRTAASTELNPICPRSDVEAAALTEIEQHQALLRAAA